MEYAGRALAGEQKRVSPRLLTWICAGAVLLFLAAPSFLLIPVSFTEGDFIEWPPRGATLRWYELFLSSPTWLWAVVRSGTLALASSILALLLGVPAAFALVRARIRGGSAILALILAPLIVPRILTAVALFYFYSKVGLVGTWFGLMLGHVVVSLPYVVITVMAVLRGYDERLDQAALVMGASRLRTFIRVTFPLIAPAVLSAFLFAFVTSLDELTIVLFISGGPLTTLPKQMWDDAILNVGPTVTAVSTVLLVVIVVLITLATRLNERSKTQS
jgi:putative spermidine/putrescine transport system permease protein